MNGSNSSTMMTRESTSTTDSWYKIPNTKINGHLWSRNETNYVKVDADSHLKLRGVSILELISIWVHWYAVNWHTKAALNSYTHSPRQRLPPLPPHCPPHYAGFGFCHAGIVNCAGIVPLFVLASLPLLCWHCRPCCAGIFALVVLVLPLSAVWSTASPAALYIPHPYQTYTT